MKFRIHLAFEDRIKNKLNLLSILVEVYNKGNLMILIFSSNLITESFWSNFAVCYLIAFSITVTKYN